MNELLLACISQVCTGRKCPASRFYFTTGIDTTASVKEYQVRTSDNAILGDDSPNDLIFVNYLTKNQIFERLNECNKGKHGPMETEVNIVIVFFHNKPKGMTPFSLFMASCILVKFMQ